MYRERIRLTSQKSKSEKWRNVYNLWPNRRRRILSGGKQTNCALRMFWKKDRQMDGKERSLGGGWQRDKHFGESEKSSDCVVHAQKKRDKMWWSAEEQQRSEDRRKDKDHTPPPPMDRRRRMNMGKNWETPLPQDMRYTEKWSERSEKPETGRLGDPRLYSHRSHYLIRNISA